MTVTYTDQVATCKRFGCFWKLLFRWKGSIYKLLWPNLIVYIALYTILSVTYRFLLDADQRSFFEKVSLHCQTYGDLIPVSFVLGFYVSIVIKRWWDQYMSIPWPDPLAVFVSTFITGQDERARLMRRTIMRYANLSFLITLRMVCPAVKKRFPSLEHIVEAGFMLPNEAKIFELLDEKTSHPKYWMPLVWATAIITRARREERIKDDFSMKTLIDEVNKFRGGCGGLLSYDWISVPLVYTQVVTLAVYTYFISTLMGNQYLDTTKMYTQHPVDLVVPIFTLLQFFFYMGWLLVAETLVNPFGEDDDDFEVNWLIDRNLQISYLIVDEMHEVHPELVKDQYWDEVYPTELPYTVASKQYYTEPFLGSTWQVEVPPDQTEFLPMSVKNMEDSQQKKTNPMLIHNKHLGKAGSMSSVSHSSSNIGFKTSSNSILNLLRKNFRRDDSKRTLAGSCASSTGRRGYKALKLSSSQAYSISSCYRTCQDNAPEEIFKMSDLSMMGTSPGSPIQKFTLLDKVVSTVHSEVLNPSKPTELEPEKKNVEGTEHRNETNEVILVGNELQYSDYFSSSPQGTKDEEITNTLPPLEETDNVEETDSGQKKANTSLITALSAKIAKLTKGAEVKSPVVSPLSPSMLGTTEFPYLDSKVDKEQPNPTDKSSGQSLIVNDECSKNATDYTATSAAIDIPTVSKNENYERSPLNSDLKEFVFNTSSPKEDEKVGVENETNPEHPTLSRERSDLDLRSIQESQSGPGEILIAGKQVRFGSHNSVYTFSDGGFSTGTSQSSSVSSGRSSSDDGSISIDNISVPDESSIRIAPGFNSPPEDVAKYVPSPAIDIPGTNQAIEVPETSSLIIHQYHKLEPIREESETSQSNQDIEPDSTGTGCSEQSQTWEKPQRKKCPEQEPEDN